MSDGLADFVAAAMPVFTGRVPVTPARTLGRLGAPEEAVLRTPDARAFDGTDGGEPACLTALRALGPLLVERLLGALELAVAGHDWSGAPSLTADLPRPAPGGYAWVATGGHDSEATSAAALLERLHPGLADRTVALATGIAAHPAVARLLTIPPAVTDEPAIAARHGAAHLGLAVAVAGAVVDQAAPPAVVERAAAIVGLGAGAAALLLRERPMPPAYAAALLAKVRAEYLLPRHTYGSTNVAGNRFGLTEREVVGQADFAGNGLVAVTDGGVVIRTGVAQGSVRVELAVLAQAPAEVESGWEEIVEVSWRAAEGRASVIAPDGADSPRLRRQTPPWPGDYRVRVHARGRDDLDTEFERYKLIVWAAPAAPETVHQRTDRLGHRLRGEPEPVRPPRPEHAYRWVRRSPLSVAATVTVVAGATLEQTLRAFGADPNRPESIDDIRRILSSSGAIESWVTALDAGDAVLVVEDNGYRGSNAAVLCAASASGRAASMFWNVNAVTRLSFAEGGQLLASFEPWGRDETVPPKVAAVLAGLDFAEPGDRTEKGLVAVERFTGRGITADDLTLILEAGVGYRVPRALSRSARFSSRGNPPQEAGRPDVR
ncbi:DUF6461 domain-containing protein [Dactylosporangium sp. NPDC000521]|uniref:DUF6461 domain-containing protein n=1 Tax=Dactylosporangium sp. NPDC000521 TaxID=3363975 RepID=UPI003699C3EF